jgi:hypothetical protein
MIVMYHKFGYKLNGNKEQIDSKMVLHWRRSNLYRNGKKRRIARSDGHIIDLNGKMTPGVQLPIRKNRPILKELEDYGVIFKEIAMPYLGYNPDKEFS